MNKIKSLLTFSLCSISMMSLNAKQEQLTAPIQTSLQTQMEIDIFNLINQARVNHLLPALIWSDFAATQARNHSLNMANKVVPFGHQGADQRFATLMSLIPTLTRFGENVAYNKGYPNPAQTAVTGWLQSPGHYANIVGDFNQTGVGVAKNLAGEYYFTQIFIKAQLPTASLKSLNDQVKSESISAPPIMIDVE